MWLLFACQGEQELGLETEEQVEQVESKGIVEDKTLHLIYSNALIGEIEPCG